MTREEAANLLFRFKLLGLMMGTLLQEPEERDACIYQVARACGRPLREFLLETDPEADPILWSQAIQALEALREDQIWIRRIVEGQGTPGDARWQ